MVVKVISSNNMWYYVIVFWRFELFKVTAGTYPVVQFGIAVEPYYNFR